MNNKKETLMFKKLFSCFKPNKPTYEWQDMTVQISSFDDYVKLALRTESKVCPWTGESFTQAQRVDHAMRGLVTEVGELVDAYKRHLYYGEELDIVNIKEEIGDCFWYIALASDALPCQVDLDDTTLWETPARLKATHHPDGCDIVDELARIVPNFWDLCVTSHVYNSTLARRLLEIFQKLRTLNHYLNATLSETLIRNLAKLAARYPDKFDGEAAIHRDLKTERNILEG